MAIREDDLQDFLDQEHQIEEGWKIRSIDEADWALGKVKQAQDAFNEKAEFAKRKIERIQQWLEDEKTSCEQTKSFFEFKLEEFYRGLEAEGKLGNKKSYKLPNGTLQMRKKAAKLERNDTQLLEIARPLGLIKVKESLDWAEFKKRLIIDGYKVIDKESGEVLDAIRVVEAECDEFSVKVD